MCRIRACSRIRKTSNMHIPNTPSFSPFGGGGGGGVSSLTTVLLVLSVWTFLARVTHQSLLHTWRHVARCDVTGPLSRPTFCRSGWAWRVDIGDTEWCDIQGMVWVIQRMVWPIQGMVWPIQGMVWYIQEMVWCIQGMVWHHTKNGVIHTGNGVMHTRNGVTHTGNGVMHTRNGVTHTGNGVTHTGNGVTPVADPEGGLGGYPPPPFRGFCCFFACQYMNIPTDLDPHPPFEEFWPRTPPPPL